MRYLQVGQISLASCVWLELDTDMWYPAQNETSQVWGRETRMLSLPEIRMAMWSLRCTSTEEQVSNSYSTPPSHLAVNICAFWISKPQRRRTEILPNLPRPDFNDPRSSRRNVIILAAGCSARKLLQCLRKTCPCSYRCGCKKCSYEIEMGISYESSWCDTRNASAVCIVLVGNDIHASFPPDISFLSSTLFMLLD